MFELPLFPLNTVLFPGMPLTLHVFEERYKQMISMCIREKRPFGVVLIREGVAERAPLPKPHAIGCIAYITDVEPLEEGQMLIASVGEERFRILSLNYDRPYLVGMVERIPLQDEDSMAAEKAADSLYPLVVKYLETLSRIGKVEGLDIAAQVPTDPQALVYLAASIISLPVKQKQTFLEADRAPRLLNNLLTTYRYEVALLRTIPLEDQGIFSFN